MFTLKEEDLLKLENFKEKKANNIINSIQRSKEIELYRFLYALGISEIGIKTAKDLSKQFKSLENIKNAKFEELTGVEDVGEIIAQNVLDYFSDEENVKEIERLFSLGVTILNEEDVSLSDNLKGLTFVLTGTLPNYSRPDMSALIEKHGGKVSSSVSKNTSYVLAGEEAGGKLDKAKALGVKIISEADILKMMEEK